MEVDLESSQIQQRNSYIFYRPNKRMNPSNSVTLCKGRQYTYTIVTVYSFIPTYLFDTLFYSLLSSPPLFFSPVTFVVLKKTGLFDFHDVE